MGRVVSRHPCCSPPSISADIPRLPYMCGGAKLVTARRWCRARLLLHQPRRAVVAYRPPAGSAAPARPHRQGPQPRSPGPRRRHLHLHLPKVREGRVPPRHPHEPAPAHPHRPGDGTGHAGGGVGGRAKRVGGVSYDSCSNSWNCSCCSGRYAPSSWLF